MPDWDTGILRFEAAGREGWAPHSFCTCVPSDSASVGELCLPSIHPNNGGGDVDSCYVQGLTVHRILY